MDKPRSNEKSTSVGYFNVIKSQSEVGFKPGSTQHISKVRLRTPRIRLVPAAQPGRSQMIALPQVSGAAPPPFGNHPQDGEPYSRLSVRPSNVRLWHFATFDRLLTNVRFCGSKRRIAHCHRLSCRAETAELRVASRGRIARVRRMPTGNFASAPSAGGIRSRCTPAMQRLYCGCFSSHH
jgi:hypothetical protein